MKNGIVKQIDRERSGDHSFYTKNFFRIVSCPCTFKKVKCCVNFQKQPHYSRPSPNPTSSKKKSSQVLNIPIMFLNLWAHTHNCNQKQGLHPWDSEKHRMLELKGPWRPSHFADEKTDVQGIACPGPLGKSVAWPKLEPTSDSLASTPFTVSSLFIEYHRSMKLYN